MNATWHGDAPPPKTGAFGLAGWARVLAKALPLAVLIFGGLVVLLTLRLIERPLYGEHRPVTPGITVFVCRWSLRIIGINYSQTGEVSPGAGAVVANHSSWLDIFALNAAGRVYFVSKSEVAAWPGIGWLARATGTVFIERDRARAAQQAELFRARLKAGHRLLFFPEGTSSDGLRVLPFKSTLYAAFFTDELRSEMRLQPATVSYLAPQGADARFYAWWGDMDFGPHLLCLLAAPRHGRVEVVYHAPLAVADFSSRKTLAAATEDAVRQGHRGSLAKEVPPDQA